MMRYAKFLIPEHSPAVQKAVDKAKAGGWKDTTYRTVQARLDGAVELPEPAAAQVRMPDVEVIMVKDPNPEKDYGEPSPFRPPKPDWDDDDKDENEDEEDPLPKPSYCDWTDAKKACGYR